MVKEINPKQPRKSQGNIATPMASPPAYRGNEDKEAFYEEQNAQDEFEQKIRDEYKEEITQEILEEHGETHIAWVPTDNIDIQKQIGLVAGAFRKLITTLNTDNQLPSRPDIMSEPERKQLIALLKGMIEELEAPFVDRGRAKKIVRWLFKLTKKAVEKEGTEAIQDALGDALNTSDSLTKTLSENSAITELFQI